MRIVIDQLPPKSGIEVLVPDSNTFRAFTEAFPGQYIYSEWMDIPEDGKIVWSEVVW